ncbi:MAG: hypothetical protein ACLPVF_06455, partial [Acidimicrobiales bacterium]
VTGTTAALTEVRPAGGAGARALHTLDVGSGPIGVATGDGAVWVADAVGGAVVRVDPARVTVSHTYPTGGDPLAVTVAGGRVWVADGAAHTVRTVFPAPGAGPLRLGAQPRELIPVGAGVWVAAANPGRVLAAGPTPRG